MIKASKNDLKQYRSLTTTLEIAKEELDAMLPEYVGDTYKDYSTGHPIIKMEQGIEDRDHFALRKRRKVQQIERISRRLRETEEFVDTVRDNDIRNILKLVYIQGYSQKQAAKKMGRGWTRDAVAKRIERFFNEK